MQIEITLTTKPKTISRFLAAAKANCSLGWIDQNRKNDTIDYAIDGRNVLIVVNKKWNNFVRVMNEK